MNFILIENILFSRANFSIILFTQLIIEYSLKFTANFLLVTHFLPPKIVLLREKILQIFPWWDNLGSKKVCH